MNTKKTLLMLLLLMAFLFMIPNVTADTIEYSDVETNETKAGNKCEFSSYWNSNGTLDNYIFSWNNSGSWVNDTEVAFSATPEWANITKFLSYKVDYVIGWRVYANNTSGDWNDTKIQTITTTTVSAGGGFGGGLGLLFFGGLITVIMVAVRVVRGT